ncbi:hypothetical protein [Nonomuraea sp. NPDC049309]|uniref:hypothetical protein n=1 Tax=Nonomuraea sp. NPDC049309 TaxID=3364350 RepID=UPI003712E806
MKTQLRSDKRGMDRAVRLARTAASPKPGMGRRITKRVTKAVTRPKTVLVGSALLAAFLAGRATRRPRRPGHLIPISGGARRG